MQPTLCFLVLVALFPAPRLVLAQEVQADCKFEFKPLKPAELAKSKEKEATDWLNSFEFSRKTFLFDIGSSKIIEPPGSPDVYREPRVVVTSQEIEVEWAFHAAPLDRQPRLFIKISRFTGEAVEGYTMLQGPNQGPRVGYWARPGKCALNRRIV